MKAVFCGIGLVCIVLLNGCVSGPGFVYAIYSTEPAGASLFQENKTLGRAPVRKSYWVTQEQFDTEIELKLSPITAKWLSGATTNVTPVLRLYRNATTPITIYRPSCAPNVAVDAVYGAKLEENTVLGRQAAAAESSANAAQKNSTLHLINTINNLNF